MAGMTPTQSTLIVAQRPLDELRAPKSFIRRRICGPGESTQLTAEEYLALSKQLDEQGAIEPRDAAGTEVNIGGILNKWNRFCDHHGESNSYNFLVDRCSKGICMAFLHFILESCNVPKLGTIRQYWRQFKMLFVRCTGYEMEKNAAGQVHKYIMGPLKEEFGLDPTVKPKPVMGVDDLLLVLIHHWAKDQSGYPIERQRVHPLSISTGLERGDRRLSAQNPHT